MIRFLLTKSFFLISFYVTSQITIKITSVPASTPSGTDIFIAGTMNNWNPGNPAFKLSKDTSGSYFITFTPPLGNVKFKFTCGSWESVEGNAQGNFIPDRSISYNGVAKTINLIIEGWESVINTNTSSASPQVSILSDSFFMPQLGRKRKIWLYLPKNYNTSSVSYPVLYMHDGQNLFDKQTSFSGEWKIDESLDSMALNGDEGCIVVGIENGGNNRLNEYSPWINPQYGGGQGDEYIDFIVQTLKPYIDNNYRTLGDKENTCMIGSSMGGLISMFAGIKYPDVFGRIGAFSSSYWFSGECYKQVSDTGVKDMSYFYLIAGDQEGGNQTADMEMMYHSLLLAGIAPEQVSKMAHYDGKHSEWYWAREFPKAYKWLFEKKTSGLNNQVNIFANIYFDGSYINIRGDKHYFGKRAILMDSSGKPILSSLVDQDSKIDVSSVHLSSGMYFLMIGNRNFKVYVHN